MKISSMLRVFLYLSIVILTAGQNVDAQDRSQGRSMVISRNGIVAAESPLAAEAGVRILERGGTDSRFRNGPLRTGQAKWIIFGPMKRQRRLIFRETAHRK